MSESKCPRCGCPEMHYGHRCNAVCDYVASLLERIERNKDALRGCESTFRELRAERDEAQLRAVRVEIELQSIRKVLLAIGEGRAAGYGGALEGNDG